MGVKLGMAYSIGGLKATIHACAVEQVLREQDVQIAFRSGSSGGSIAAAMLSTQAVAENGIPWLIDQLSRIKPGSLLDRDLDQQALDLMRSKTAQQIKRLTFGLIRVKSRKGDKPLLGYFRGNAMESEFTRILKGLGPITTPCAIVSTALDARFGADAAPIAGLAVLSGDGAENAKKIRYFEVGDNDPVQLGRALRASTSIPLVLCPCWCDDHYEVDGGVLSLTTEEVAADWITENAGGNRPMLLIADMQSLPTQSDNEFDDVLEYGTSLLRIVGSQLQAMNHQYAHTKIASQNGVGLLRFKSPQIPVKAGQFDAHLAKPVFNAYLAYYRRDVNMQRAVETYRRHFASN